MNIDEIKKKATEGNSHAIFLLALEYLMGANVERNFTEALALLESAASKEFPPANFALGVMYGNGLGVPQDFKKAYDYFDLATIGGFSEAKEFSSHEEPNSTLFEKALDFLMLNNEFSPMSMTDAIPRENAGKSKTREFKEYTPSNSVLTESKYDGKNKFKYYIRSFYSRKFTPKELNLLQLKKMAEEGDAEAQNDLGVIYFIEKIVPQNIKEAKKWFGEAILQGYETARENMVKMALNIVDTADFDDDFKNFLLESAEMGLPCAQLELAHLYFTGSGFAKDKPKAIELLIKAAEKGIEEAQYLLAEYYFKGDGVPQNKSESAKWLTKVAEGGNVAAQHDLAISYQTGEGVPRDLAAAIKWFTLSAEGGMPNSQFQLSIIYFNGEGTQVNVQEGLKWLVLSANAGHEQAMTNLGRFYYHGMYVRKDINLARKYWTLAARKGSALAKEYLALL